jgi:hypothetical protein
MKRHTGMYRNVQKYGDLFKTVKYILCVNRYTHDKFGDVRSPRGIFGRNLLKMRAAGSSET